ncbi:hypothetical protein F6455_03835 [Proteobacteria bacterium 005FR1]|nr:hypothetical protein [Proteobacteria bacterium 005FR1]
MIPGEAERKQNESPLPGTGVLWLGWFIGIVAWVLHLSISYSLVEWHCQNPGVLQSSTLKLILHGTTLATLALAIAGIWLTWTNWQRCRGGSGDTTVHRIIFMARSGCFMNVAMAVLIVVEGIPNFVFPVCVA